MHTLIHKKCFVLLVINQKIVQMEITKCLSWDISKLGYPKNEILYGYYTFINVKYQKGNMK